MAFAALALVFAFRFNTIIDWDVATRSMQGEACWRERCLLPDPEWVWLPAYQLLIAWVHGLTGLPGISAGALVSALSGAMLCREVLRFLSRRGASLERRLLATVLLLTSGMLLSLSSQAMTEAFCAMLLTVLVLRVPAPVARLRELLPVSLVAAIGCGSRYELWLIVATVCGVLVVRRWLGHGGWRLRDALVFAAAPAAVSVAWLFGSHVNAGSAVHFLSVMREVSSKVATTYSGNVGLSIGVVLLYAFVCLGFTWLGFFDRRRSPQLDAATVAFVVLSLTQIIGTFRGTNVFHPRFGLMFIGPAIASFAWWARRDLALAATAIGAFVSGVFLHELHVRAAAVPPQYQVTHGEPGWLVISLGALVALCVALIAAHVGLRSEGRSAVAGVDTSLS